MRILCVHGIGQNSAIFEAFTESIRHFLPEHYEYTFFDGADECEPAPGIGEIFPGPYFCHYMKFYTSYVAQSHKYIADFIAEEGPFDGVISFSQGAACLSSMLLHHENQYPHLAPLFRFAVFMNGSAPICASTTSGYDVTPGYRNVSLTHFLGASALTRPRSDMENTKLSHTDDTGIYDENGKEQCVRWWIPQVDPERISIPTVHVHGAKDGWLKEAYDLLAMCAEDSATVYQHGGGHEMPKRVEVCRKVAELIEKAAIKSQTMMY